jgi:L-seryl-tRNA(Ser) seleniumtransferase
MGDDPNAPLRDLPGVDRVMDALEDSAPALLLAWAARLAIAEARERIQGGGTASGEEIVERARDLLQRRVGRLLRPLINATGVLIHTNLGRVPLGDRQLAAAREVSSAYSNLEYDLERGKRGTRYTHAAELLSTITGAESALVVNNNAAAVLMSLAALCSGREVVISRGELIEIGGEFRIPEVMRAAGVRLVEVGTTNRTHLVDYERAITEHTAALMKVHPSNYRVVGFTSSVSSSELGRLARGRGVLFMHDLGSGLLGEPDDLGFTMQEPLVENAVAEGADIVTFSGDKLLGGPQAGLILGRADLIATIAKHPLMRAVRPDKVTLAILQETLAAYLEGTPLDLPLWKLATVSAEELESRARALVESLDNAGSKLKAEAVPTAAVSGGGSMPGAEIPSWGVALAHGEISADGLDAALRGSDPPVVGRIEDDRLLLDLRTVFAEQDEALARLVNRASSDST